MFSFYHQGYFRFHVSFWWCRQTKVRMWLVARVCSKILPPSSSKLHLRGKHHDAQIYWPPTDVVEFPFVRLPFFFLQTARHHPKVRRHHTYWYTSGATSGGMFHKKYLQDGPLPEINGVISPITCFINLINFKWSCNSYNWFPGSTLYPSPSFCWFRLLIWCFRRCIIIGWSWPHKATRFFLNGHAGEVPFLP